MILSQVKRARTRTHARVRLPSNRGGVGGSLRFLPQSSPLFGFAPSPRFLISFSLLKAIVLHQHKFKAVFLLSCSFN